MISTAGVVAVGVTASPASADWSPERPNDPANPATVTADALPTVQIDGVVWSQAVAGDTAYAGGNFTEARPAGTALGSGVPRANMVAYDVTTGVMTDFAPTFNGQIRAVAVSPDQQTLYVGGAFTTVNGQSRQHLAAFDVATGDLLDFAPDVNGEVQALAIGHGVIYAGGAFGGVGNQDRGNLAAFDPSGALLAWAPVVGGGDVQALALDPDGSKLAVGGSFISVNGDDDAGDGLALFDASTGEVQPLPAGQWIHNGNNTDDSDGAISALAADATSFYGAGYTYASKSAGSVEGTFAVNWDDGSLRWIADCHGDSYSVHPQGDVIYTASHSHYCENMGGVRQGAGGVGDYPYFRGVAFSETATGTATWEPDQGRYWDFSGQPTPSMLTWLPSINTGTATGQNQGAWSVAGNSDYLVMGGEFTRVNGQAQQGLVRFARADLAPQEEGPTLFNATYPLHATSTESGTVRLSWQTNQDIDNDHLTYKLQRRPAGGNSSVINARSVRAHYWNPLGMTYTDSDVTPGQQYEYRIQASDPGGLTANSTWVPVTVATTGGQSAYLDAVHSDAPTDWWGFGEAADSTNRAADFEGNRPLVLGSGVIRGTQGAVGSDTSNLGATFSGTDASVGRSWPEGVDPAAPSDDSGEAGEGLDWAPDVFTLEAWFRSTSTTGGRIVGWEAPGRNAKADRHVYLDDAGHLLFGIKPDANRVSIASPNSYNDGDWHQVAATLSPEGMKLYVDGAQVAANPDVTVGEHLSVGQWTVGGGAHVTGVQSQPTDDDFTGDIDEVAVYKQALSASDLAGHFSAAGSIAPNQAPTASFATTSIDKLAAAFDASGSNDPDGSIASYRWDFGDGTSALTTGPTTTHEYVDAGTYTVTLTVVDGDGRPSNPSVGAPITVTDPDNQAPTADFTATATAPNWLRVTLDASPSTDSDGTIKAWAWDFGNGRTSTSQTPRASYSAAGDYTVELTVTDNDGATATLSRRVTVSDSGPPVLSDPPANQAPTASFTSTQHGLTANLDASGSTDADGTVVSYAWTFGDGKTGTGVSPSHTYAGAGSYPVTLTVTDDDGASSTAYTADVTVTGPSDPPANHAPTASFTSTQDVLTANFDASGSTDADGTVVSYAWTFGDGKTGTGVSPSHTYAGAGSYPVTLTVTDDDGASSTAYTAGVTVTGPPATNEAPHASFATHLRGNVLTARSTATDPDGTIASTQWTFGDGHTSSATNATHRYTRAGRYTVTLSVTDDAGATTAATRTVTVHKAATTTTVEAAKKAHQGQRVKVAMTVRPTLGMSAAGTLKLYDKNHVLRTFKLGGSKAGVRTVTVRLELKIGTHRLRTVYSGTPTVAGSRSTIATVRILR